MVDTMPDEPLQAASSDENVAPAAQASKSPTEAITVKVREGIHWEIKLGSVTYAIEEGMIQMSEDEFEKYKEVHGLEKG